jgi:tetraacyldisaccharide 4'-kinase
MLSSVYAAVARRRRRYYAARPYLQQRLSQPVISIGNIAAGGRAKTPLAALVAARLRDMGERPAILSRGYARRLAPDGVVVVRDPSGIRADLDRAGDEPLMLARQLDGVAVLVSRSRYLAGHLAERCFGCTVHVLDDGFQHFELRRDADLLVVERRDIDSPQTLPSGHLREPVDAAGAADAFIALDVPEGDVSPVESLADGRPVWRAQRRPGPARLSGSEARGLTPAAGPVVAVAGIATPAVFFRDLRSAGWTIAREMPYRDHHRFSPRDIQTIIGAARETQAAVILTTEKDLVRMLPFRPFRVPVAYVPLTVEIEPSGALDAWLRGTLARARS